MADIDPFAIVLRFGKVTLPVAELEARLDTEMDRYERERNQLYYYAQINIDNDHEPWNAAYQAIERFGPEMQKLLLDGDVGEISLDVALDFLPNVAVMTRSIPSRIAEIVGRFGIDIDVSIYVSGDT
jgi:hypothetical protein